MKCRICGREAQPFMSFGRMPIANGFVTPGQFKDEYFFELAPVFCEGCSGFQILEQPAAQLMFHENYAFFSRTSRRMAAHFADFARWLRGRVEGAGASDPFVVELGSNDGIMLEHFAKAGIRHLGVEPSANVAAEARRHGVDCVTEFFTPALAGRIAAERGRADAISAANVMCHIPDLHDIARAADRLLGPRGILVFEEPYLGDMIAKTSYDQIYDEHVYVFSALSVSNLFERHGFELIDALPQSTHGGSMRYVLARKGAHAKAPAVAEVVARERAQGLHLPETYAGFRRNCERSKEQLLKLLQDLKAQGRRVAGYGATSKSTTVINYCGIDPSLIEFISDTTPIKQGKFTPGAHIPVKPYEAFCAQPPDYALLFAWNHSQEIFDKEKDFSDNGGKWIVYVPDVSVIG